MRVADVEGLEGVGGAFSSLIRLWKCVEKSEAGEVAIQKRRSRVESRIAE
jgi:hypothetical protein